MAKDKKSQYRSYLPQCHVFGVAVAKGKVILNQRNKVGPLFLQL